MECFCNCECSFSPPDPDHLCLHSLCETQTQLDHLHPINKGNKSSLSRSGFSRRLCLHHLNHAKIERTSSHKSPASFGFASLGVNVWTSEWGKIGVSVTPVSLHQYFHEGEVVVDE